MPYLCEILQLSMHLSLSSQRCVHSIVETVGSAAVLTSVHVPPDSREVTAKHVSAHYPHPLLPHAAVIDFVFLGEIPVYQGVGVLAVPRKG